MKIYFAGSIRGGREDKELYCQLISFLKQYGEVLTEHIGNIDLHNDGEVEQTDQFIHDRDLKWIKESDVMVAEVTNVSMGVGYEIGRAECLNKKILCLYRLQDDKKLSAMISGSDKLDIKLYNSIEEAKGYIDEYLNELLNKSIEETDYYINDFHEHLK